MHHKVETLSITVTQNTVFFKYVYFSVLGTPNNLVQL